MRPFRLLILLAAVCGLSACTTSQRLNYLEVPTGELAADDLPDLAAYQERYGQYDGVYLLQESTHEHSGSRDIGSDWTYSRVVRKRYLVFDPTDQELTSFRIYGEPDRFYVRLVAPDGSQRTHGVEDLEVERDEDGDLRFVLVFPDVVAGTYVDLGWEQAWSIGATLPPLEHDIALQFTLPCEQAAFTYAYPSWWQVDVKKIRRDHEPQLTVTEDLDSRKTTMHYQARDIPALEEEPYAPFFKEMAEYLQFQIRALDMKVGRLERPDSWQALADQFREHALDRAHENADRLARKSADITASCTTDRERAQAILAHVRDEIAVITESRDGDYWKVIEEGTGSVIDVVGLTQALLQGAGIEAYLLFAHSAHDGWFDPDYISMDQFHYPAVRAVIDGEDHVLFPYLEHLPLDHTPRWLQDQMGLIIAAPQDHSTWDTGQVVESGAAELWRLPGGSRGDNATLSTFDVTIAADGLVTVEETRTLRGEAAFVLRNRLADLDAQEREDAMQEMLTYTDGDVILEEHELQNLDRPDEPLAVVMRYTIDNLVMLTPEETIFQTGGLLSPLSAVDVKVDPDRRQNPIRIAYDEQHRKEVTIHYPAAWSVTTALADVAAANDFGTLEVSYQHEPGTLRVSQRVALHRISANAARYGELLEIMGRKRDLQLPAVVFSVVGAS